ncbi:MAG: 3'-5' exonuclease [Elusimicrobia bacterium]|nr:3'-5' exonuclease [Elusimicrobiota bacterium]
MTMKNDRPIAFFDLEATGVAPLEDRIVDIAIIRREIDGSEKIFSSLVNPRMRIPTEAVEVHHISDEMVRGAPSFKDLAPRLLEIFAGADLGGFGIARFDIPMLGAEFKRAGFEFKLEARRVIDGLVIFQRMEPRNLSAAYRFYCGKPLDGAHRAEPDARAAYEVLCAQLARYDALPQGLDALSAFCQARDGRHVDSEGKFVWRNGEASFNFGKHRTLSLREVVEREPSYLEWLMRAEKTTPELAQICREALMGRFPARSKD